MVKVHRMWHALCIELIEEYYLLADILFLVVILDLDKYIFPWQACFVRGLS
jgi:hypothetical protein